MAVKLYASDGTAEFAGANTVARMNLLYFSLINIQILKGIFNNYK